MTKEIEEKGMSMDEARKRNMWSIIPISKLPDNSPVLAITQYPSKGLAEFHLAEECIVPAILTPSGDVQERAKEYVEKVLKWPVDGTAEGNDMVKAYLAGHAGASDMKGELKAFWTDELVLEFAVRSHLGKGREMTIEEFKKMKLTKPQ
jgi:hypothetical protein